MTKIISNNIIKNKKAVYNYFFEKELEAGILLHGWEIKSFYARKVDITNGYITFKEHEAYLLGSVFQPISSISIKNVDVKRTRKLLLHRYELDYLIGIKNKKKSIAIVALSLYWKKNWIKLKIGIGKGKKKFDKRQDEKTKEWKMREKKILKEYSRHLKDKILK